MTDNTRTERRLAAILAADVVGYSRLMGADEEGTLSALMAHRRELIDPLIKQHEGRIVKTTGDGLLFEFASIVDAVRCAIIVNQGMEDRNANVKEDRRIRFRVGINVAARLETLAEPGEIYVSGTVREHIGEKLPVHFTDMGKHAVKNIARPIHVYRIDHGHEEKSKHAAGRTVRPAVVERPSIAVLPFDNMSGDPEQEYFADGMVEDIITGLSRFHQFFVVARNTMFTFKGRTIDVRDVAGELGVRYVLEGSVRRAGNRLRINAQLIDAGTGGHIWADRFDGELEDVFDFQDRITTAVIGVLEPSIRKAELEKIRRHLPEDMSAYDFYLQGMSLMMTTIRQESHAEAYGLLSRALAIDPNYIPALALSSWCLEMGHTRNWPALTDDDAATGIAQAQTVLSSGTNDENSVAMAGFALQMMSRDFAAGSAAAHRALKLNPNSVIVQAFAGLSLVFAGEAGTARTCFEKALQLSPADPSTSIFYTGIGLSHFTEGDYDKALEMTRQAIVLNPNRETGHWVLLPVLSLLGHDNEARDALKRLCELNPRARGMEFWEGLPFGNLQVKAALVDGARRVIEAG